MGLVEHRWTENAYLTLVERGELSNTQLLDGKIFERVTPSPRHNRLVNEITRTLAEGFGIGHLWIEKPIRLSGGLPEPDLAVLKSDFGSFTDDWPTPEDVSCVIEVAISSADRDIIEKLPLYRREHIPTVIIVVVDTDESGLDKARIEYEGVEHDAYGLIVEVLSRLGLATTE